MNIIEVMKNIKRENISLVSITTNNTINIQDIYFYFKIKNNIIIEKMWRKNQDSYITPYSLQYGTIRCNKHTLCYETHKPSHVRN